MIEHPMDVLSQFPVRKSKRQKQAFRDAVGAYAASLGYASSVEKGSFGSQNVVIGDPERASMLITAHYDTCARMPIPNLITPCNPWAFFAYQLLMAVILIIPGLLLGFWAGQATGNRFVFLGVFYVIMFGSCGLMMLGPANGHNANDNTSGVVTVLETARTLPPELRSKICFALFDLEEAGLLGSAAHRKAHKTAVARQVMLNLDCVGDGDEFLLFPTGTAQRNPGLMDWLKSHLPQPGKKSLTLRERGFSVYPSDQRGFPLGVGVAAFHRHPVVGLYCGKIHTRNDTILEKENVIILRDFLLNLAETVQSN